jgi:hypothetical protein
VEVSDDGAVWMLTTRLSDEIEGSEVIFEDVPPIMVRQTVGIADEVSTHARATAISGFLGVAATGIAGSSAYLSGRG